MSTVIGAWPTAACQAARQPCEPSTSYIPLQSRNPCPHTRPAPRARLTSRPATAAFMDAQVASSGSGLVTGLWTLVIGAAALYFGRELLQQREADEGLPRCATCGGSGKVDCFCQRWSDGDVGCRSCQGTGKATCSNCGGGGTAQPVVQRIYARSDNSVGAAPRQNLQTAVEATPAHRCKSHSPAPAAA